MPDFQWGGDYHFSHENYRKKFEYYLKPICKNLILTGDNTHATSYTNYTFLSYVAKNWEKVYIIMGNQEYEYCDPAERYSFEACENAMKNTIKVINSTYNEDKLILVQDTYYDIPNTDIRLIGAVLWSKNAYLGTISKDIDNSAELTTYKNKYTNKEGNWYEIKDKFLPLQHFKQREPFPYILENPLPVVNSFDNPAIQQVVMLKEDIEVIHQKELSFLREMLTCTNKRIILISHYVPEYYNFPNDNVGIFDDIEFLCTNTEGIIQAPIIACIAGHAHRKVNFINKNNVPIYVNWKDEVITF